MVTFHHNLIKKISFGIYKVQIKEQSWRSHIARLQGLLLIKTVGYWQWCRQKGQRNRIESQETDPYKYRQLISDKRTFLTNGAETVEH